MSEMVWRLMVWDVPDRLGGLLSRLGFRQTKKNAAHWWRIFDPSRPGDKAFAEKCKAELIDAGLKGSWSQVEAQTTARSRPNPGPHQKKFARHAPTPNREGFGGRLNARPIRGSWRRR